MVTRETPGAVVTCARCKNKVRLLPPGLVDTSVIRAAEKDIAAGMYQTFARAFKGAGETVSTACPVCGMTLMWPSDKTALLTPAAKARHRLFEPAAPKPATTTPKTADDAFAKMAAAMAELERRTGIKRAGGRR